MGKFLYGGVLLPDIDTVWTDKVTYPYAIIVVNENKSEILHISPVPFIYEDPNVNISSGTGSPRYLNDSDEWVDYGSGSGFTGFGVKWTSHNILDTSGNSIYLAESEPVPVQEGFCLKSWLTGFALGLAGKPMPLVTRQPVVPGGF